MQTLFRRPDRIPEPLYVIGVMFNPLRYRTRWKLYEDFSKRVAESGAILYTVEVAFGEREFAITDESNPNHLRLRTYDPLWLKENAINLAIQRLPYNWQYVAWVDADLSFARDDWADETKHQLQHHPVVQMWSQAQDLNSNHEVLKTHRSLAWCYQEGEWPAGQPLAPAYYYFGMDRQVVYRHPGYAWAIRRDAFDGVGGLLDFSVIGSGDYHMAYAILGECEGTLKAQYHPRFKARVMAWQERALAVIQKNLGYVSGTVFHYWHGSQINRKYNDRWKILVDTDFNPDLDIIRDSQGLWQLTPHGEPLRRAMQDYLRGRDEDANR